MVIEFILYVKITSKYLWVLLYLSKTRCGNKMQTAWNDPSQASKITSLYKAVCIQYNCVVKGMKSSAHSKTADSLLPLTPLHWHSGGADCERLQPSNKQTNNTVVVRQQCWTGLLSGVFLLTAPERLPDLFSTQEFCLMCTFGVWTWWINTHFQTVWGQVSACFKTFPYLS